MEYSSIFVCLMGMGTVFFGLICLIALTYLMSAVVGRGKKAAPAPVPAAPQTAGEVTPELVAAALVLLVIGYAVSDGTGGYSIADIANQPYYLIAVGVMVLALLLSLIMIRIEKELPKEMRPK